jgi:hypothetical protein
MQMSGLPFSQFLKKYPSKDVLMGTRGVEMELLCLYEQIWMDLERMLFLESQRSQGASRMQGPCQVHVDRTILHG